MKPTLKAGDAHRVNAVRGGVSLHQTRFLKTASLDTFGQDAHFPAHLNCLFLLTSSLLSVWSRV